MVGAMSTMNQFFVAVKQLQMLNLFWRTLDTGVSSHTATNFKYIPLTAMNLPENSLVKERIFVKDFAAKVQKCIVTSWMKPISSNMVARLISSIQDLDLPAVTQCIIRVIKSLEINIHT